MAGLRKASATWSTHSPVFDEAWVTRETWPSAESKRKPAARRTPTGMPVHHAGGRATRSAMPAAERHTDTRLTTLGVHPQAAAAAATTLAPERFTHRM